MDGSVSWSDGRIDLSDEMRPPVNRAPTCPSPQQLTQEELQGDRQPEGSDGRIDLSDEMSPLLNTAPTCPSSQQHNQDKMPPEDFAVDIKKLVGFFEPTNAECTLPPDTPTGSDGRTDLSDENRPLFHRAPTCPSPQKLTQDERPLEESVKADEDKESLPARGTSAPTAPLLSPLTQNSPNMESNTAGKPKEDTDSDQVTGEPAEESDRESDSSDLEKINGPHDSSEEKQLSTVPEEKGSEITVHEKDSNLPQYETHTQEGEHQEMNKQVSGVRNESENDPEDVNKELTSSQLPQIPTEPENHNTDTAHTQADKEKGDKTRHESDTSEEQSDNSTAEANRGGGESEAAENDNQCDQN